MDNVESKLESATKEIEYFEKMVSGAEKLIQPWKTAVAWLVAALIACNLFWGLVHGYAIYKAYQEPTTYEQGQAQDFSSEKQEQTNKGSAN